MAQYSVKAPDGKMLTISGPDGASQADILAQAQALYKPRTAPPVPAKPAANPQTAQYLQKYQQLRASIAKSNASPDQIQRALLKFDSDPRAQKLRSMAGLANLSTPQQEVRATARNNVAAGDNLSLSDLVAGRKSRSQAATEAGTAMGQNASTGESAAAGLSNAFFGAPDMLAAAGLRFLPSAVTGNTSDASYGNILQVLRARTDAAVAAHPGAALGSEIGASLLSGRAAARGVQAIGGRLLASAAPVAQRIGRAIEAATTLQKGQKVANAGRIALAGGATGAAQAAGTGKNVGEGLVTGAVAAPVAAVGFKAAQVISRPFRDVMRLSSAGQILSRLTTASRSQLERLAAEYRSATGAEPTLFELLPLADRNKILKTAVVGKDAIVERTSNAIRNRANNLGPEMSARARQILQPQRDFIQGGITNDLARARGVQPHQLPAEDHALIGRAMDSPTDMSELRDVEARAIMAPHDNTPVVNNLEDLFPQVPGPAGGAPLAVDPEVTAVIRSAAGTLRQRAANQGVTAGDITDMMSTLRGDLARGGIEGRNAQRAIDHLQGILDNQAPDAGAAARQMSDAYAARSRMIEGMKAGNATQLRDEVQVGTNRGQARTVRNAYDTPEGAGGRSLGQGNRIAGDLAGSPEEALRATVRQSRGSTGRALGQNLGQPEADALGVAARAQDESAQALAAASAKAQGGSGDGADAETLVQAIAGLHPSSFITTKAGALRKLLDMTYIPESRARTMVDMLFSQDPAMTQRALRAIGNSPNGAATVTQLASLVGRLSADGQDSGEPQDAIPDNYKAPEVQMPDMPDPNAAPAEDPAAAETPAPDAGGDSPYSDTLQHVYDNENPDLIALVQRVKGQESGGHQIGADGQPVTSSKGATGIMQVMPDTAPEAARLAGVPWDENAYKTDAHYNELLGIAYLSEMLRKYGGDVNRALAAYNAGPGRVDEALSNHGDSAWLDNLPAETQDYVSKVG